jgi:hypothetical protein
MSQNLEASACQPHPVDANGFNPNADLPYGCTTEHIRLAMNDFVDFLGFINQQLYTRELERFESMLMPANFSSLVGEFMITSRFVKVVGAALTKADWSFSGRSENSRRTITASVTNSGYQKMMANWIYQAPRLP